MIFNIDEDSMFNAIDQAMKQAEADLSEQQVQKIIEQIDNSVPGLIELLLNDTKEHWKQEAIDSGTGWGQKYANAIKSKSSGNEGEVYIDENMKDSTGQKSAVFVRKIEQGVQSWSIRDALMKSEKAKTGKDGIKFMIIPFPVMTPSKKGQGKASSRFGGREMSAEVHAIVKNGGRAPKGTLSTSGQDISGLTRYETRQFHSQYAMFRIVKADSKGWQYPSIAATPVFPSVIDYVNKRIQEILHEFCVAIIKENS